VAATGYGFLGAATGEYLLQRRGDLHARHISPGEV
jgi:hypothetical protein